MGLAASVNNWHLTNHTMLLLIWHTVMLYVCYTAVRNNLGNYWFYDVMRSVKLQAVCLLLLGKYYISWILTSVWGTKKWRHLKRAKKETFTVRGKQHH